MKTFVLYVISVVICNNLFSQLYVEADMGYSIPIFMDSYIFNSDKDHEYLFNKETSIFEVTDETKSKININEGYFYRIGIGYHTVKQVSFGLDYTVKSSHVFSPKYYNNNISNKYFMKYNNKKFLLLEKKYLHEYTSHEFFMSVGYTLTYNRFSFSSRLGVSVNKFNLTITEKIDSYQFDELNNEMNILSNTENKYKPQKSNLLMDFSIPIDLSINYKINNSLFFIVNMGASMPTNYIHINGIEKTHTKLYKENSFIEADVTEEVNDFYEYNITTINTSIGIRYYFGKSKEEAVE